MSSVGSGSYAAIHRSTISGVQHLRSQQNGMYSDIYSTSNYSEYPPRSTSPVSPVSPRLKPQRPPHRTVTTSADAALAAFDSADDELESSSEFKPYTSSSPVHRQQQPKHLFDHLQQHRIQSLANFPIKQAQQQLQQQQLQQQQPYQLNEKDNLENSIIQTTNEFLKKAQSQLTDQVLPEQRSTVSSTVLNSRPTSLTQSSLQRLSTPKNTVPITLPKFTTLQKSASYTPSTTMIMTSLESSKLNNHPVRRSVSDSAVLSQTPSPQQQQQQQQQQRLQQSNQQIYQSYDNHTAELYDKEKRRTQQEQAHDISLQRDRTLEKKALPSSPTSRDTRLVDLQSKQNSHIFVDREQERSRIRISDESTKSVADNRAIEKRRLELKKRAEDELKKEIEAAEIKKQQQLAEQKEQKLRAQQQLRQQLRQELKEQQLKEQQQLQEQLILQKERLAAEKSAKDAARLATAAAAATNMSTKSIMEKIAQPRKSNSEVSLETMALSKSPVAPHPLRSPSSLSTSSSFSSSFSSSVIAVSTPIVSNPRGLVGLQNLGNTCFMNSALQCLSNTPPLAEYFASQGALKHLNPRSPSKGEVAVAFAELMGNMWSSSTSSSSSSSIERPSRLKSAVASVTRRFAGYEQHDAQEFLIALLDALHDDTNRVKTKLPFEELNDPPTSTDKEISNDWWRYFTARNDSLVWNLFAGQLKSETRCKVCGHRSRVFDPFMDLSVPIPKSECTLGDCLEKFVEAETIPGGEWRCSKCKEFQVAEKELAIFRLPQVLVVHLKRFSIGTSSSSGLMFGGIFGGGNGGNKSKINTSVKFPIEGFDVKEYLAPESPERTLGKNNTLYDLIGVVNHSGSLNGGHYVADCMNRDDKKWYHYNDSRVSSSPKGSLSSTGAYILFYLRRSSS